ncbi:MAG TPA: aldo/keto reductase, partial [Acidimicrobiales bacterium]|nr:aldo/keto reductase [Acidimicrobiales bacterium]
VAHEIGASPAQVAIRWTMQRAPFVPPIIGARRLEQLVDNLGAAEVELPEELVRRLDKVAPFEPGFPTTFIEQNSSWVLGAGAEVG